MNRHQVIIVGAGMAGLSAFLKLTECGFTDVLILEASNRVGGRINTISFRKWNPYMYFWLPTFDCGLFWKDHTYVELGAQWIHGRKGNPIYELAKQLHLVDESEGSIRRLFVSIVLNYNQTKK